jgi:hypothetical protein
MRSFIYSSALLISFFLTSFAYASPVVIYSGDVASAVNGIVFNGVTYNVTFQSDAIDSLFDGDATDALVVANELDAALNTTTAGYVSLQGCCAINQFIVEDAGDYAGVSVTSYGNPGEWGIYHLSQTGDGSVAVFTVAPTPEPSAIVLLGTGVLGLAGVARRRIFSRQRL